MQRSPQWHKGRFHNPQPLWNDYLSAFGSILRRDANSTPKEPLPVARPTRADLQTDSASGLRATWLGHSTVYLEIDGIRILTDPVWGRRASPLGWVGPKRFFAPLIPLEELPVPQVVAISHDHYDHLDHATILRIKDWNTRFIVPLGVGARLEGWGVPAVRITELDWWETTRVGDLEVACTPARHASGRSLFDKDRTLWGGFAFLGPSHRVYYSGDTGMFPGLADIGTRLGPFDLTMIEAGAYGQAWPDWHLGPEQALEAHRMAQGRVLLPVHWGLFDLAAHGWTEPIERVLAAARVAGATVAVPWPGESFEPHSPAGIARWWPSLPWKTEAEVPIRATPDGLKPQAAPGGGVVKIVLFGATGMIGQGVLRECLLDPDVTQVISIGRGPSGGNHPKLKEILHQGFFDFSAIEGELSGLDAGFFCLGVSAAGMTEAAYRRVTHDLTLAAAAVLYRLNPGMTFSYISGAGADSTELGRIMWARVKGVTENALLRQPFKAVYLFRPGAIQPLHGITSRTKLYRILYRVLGPFLPLLKAVSPDSLTTTEQLGKAMLHVGLHGAPKAVLEMPDINRL